MSLETEPAEQVLSSRQVRKQVSRLLKRARHSWIASTPGKPQMYGTAMGHAAVSYEKGDNHEVLVIQLMTHPRKVTIFRDEKPRRDPERIGNCVIFSFLDQRGKTVDSMNTSRAAWEANVLVGLCDMTVPENKLGLLFRKSLQNLSRGVGRLFGTNARIA